MRLACIRARRLMKEDSGGQLTGAARRRFESHLEVCPGCREEYEGLREVRALLASAPKYVAPAGLSARVMRNLDSGPIGARRRLPGFTFIRTMEAALILAVIAAGIISGNFVATGLFPQPQDTRVSVAGRGSTIVAYSIDAFDSAPPETVGAAFVTEDMNEK